MLVLWDRGFDSNDFLAAVHATGARVLGRIRQRRRPPVLQPLADSSYLSVIGGVRVRIIEAQVSVACTDGSDFEGSYWLVTTFLDARRHPADHPVHLYHERWEHESAYFALRHTVLHGRVQRSHDPVGLDVDAQAGTVLEHTRWSGNRHPPRPWSRWDAWGALHYQLGEADAMAAQLDHLLTVGALPGVSLGIIPAATKERHQWPRKTFHVYDDKLLSVELVTARIRIKQPSEIEQYVKALGQLRNMAVYGADARALRSKPSTHWRDDSLLPPALHAVPADADVTDDPTACADGTWLRLVMWQAWQ